MPKKPPCHPEACSAQTCVTKNMFNPDKCDGHMRKLYECCAAMYASGEVKESSSCPMEGVVKRWLQAHSPAGKKS